MPEQVEITLHGSRLHLLAGRGLYWPAQQLLGIADLHLAKDDTFRRHGIAVPSGGTTHDLARLERLLAHTAATRVLILGDVLHGHWQGEQWRAPWLALQQRWPHVRWQALAGNHDRHLAGAGLGLELLGEQVDIDGIALRHEPADGSAPTICGHLHPVLRLPGLPRRVPVFWLAGQQLVLPAFSAFTGGYLLRPRRGERYFACDDEAIVPI